MANHHSSLNTLDLWVANLRNVSSKTVQLAAWSFELSTIMAFSQLGTWAFRYLAFGGLGICTLGHLDTWVFGHLGTWVFGHLDTWTFGCLDTWTLGCLDTWTLGYLDTWSLENLGISVHRCPGICASLRPEFWTSGHLKNSSYTNPESCTGNPSNRDSIKLESVKSKLQLCVSRNGEFPCHWLCEAEVNMLGYLQNYNTRDRKARVHRTAKPWNFRSLPIKCTNCRELGNREHAEIQIQINKAGYSKTIETRVYEHWNQLTEEAWIDENPDLGNAKQPSR